MHIKWIQWKDGMKFGLSITIGILILSHCVHLTYQTYQTADEDDILSYTISPSTIEFKLDDKNFTLLEVKCKEARLKNDIPKVANNFICENLKPCTDYRIIAKIRDSTNEILNRTRFVKTNYTEPNAIFDMVLPNNDSIFLAWNVTNSGCVSKFNITTIFKNAIIRNVSLENSIKHYEIDKLSPCEGYEMTLGVIDINNVLVRNVTTKMETSFSDLDLVQGVTFSENPDKSIKVHWNPSIYESCIHYYYIKWTKLDCLITHPEKCTWTYHNSSNPKETELNIYKLDGCAKYTLVITPNGDNMEHVFYVNFTSPQQSPEPVQDLRVTRGSPTNVTITWKPPNNHTECIKNYKIILCGSDLCDMQTIPKNETKIEFKMLEPCGSYNVTVIIITNDNLEGKPTFKNFLMDDASPSEIRKDSIRIYPKELTIKWKVPIFSKLCINQYRIKGWPTTELEYDKNLEFIMYVNGTSAHIPQLVSCMKYTIEITPITKGQKEGLKALYEVETDPMPSDPPNEPETKSITSHSLEITTKDIDQTNRCPILVARFTCETEEEGKIKYAEQTVPGYIDVFTAVLKPLSPFTAYTCYAYVVNIAGWSKKSKARFTTGKYYPDIPEAITATSISNTSVNIKWAQPRFVNGLYVIYKVYIQTLGPKYTIPAHCPPIKLENFTQTVESQQEYLFKDVLPYVEYSVQIAAKNDYGTGAYSIPVTVITDPGISDPVEEFAIREIHGPEVSSTYKASVTLSWQLPCQSHGEIIGFEGEFLGVRPDYQNHDLQWLKEYLTLNINQVYFEWIETRLKPEYYYTISVKVRIKGISERSEVKRIGFVSPSGIPPRINITGNGSISAFSAKNPTSSAVLSFSPNILKTHMGTIIFMAILLSEKGCQNDPPLKYDKINSLQEWPEVPSWHDMQSFKCARQYQTTPIRWNPSKDRNFGRTINPRHSYEYTIGTDDCSKKYPYCNGPLKPDTKYSVVIRLFTKSGYSDVALLEFKTDSVIQLYFILLLIVTCLLFSFILGLSYLWFTSRIKWHRNSINGIDEQSGDISAKNFLMHYEDLTKRDKLQREFKELSVVANDLSLSNTASKSNETKNRYSNIFPYDKNRVILGCDADGSDYINASFINGYKHKKEYIATQGPKPESFIDFWKMILQYKVRIIVMLTQFREGEIIKCHQYFPQLSKEMKFGHNIEVRCTKETPQELYDRREILVEHTGDGILHKVVHYYFKKWPDHDCPSDPNDLITFVRKIKSEKNHSAIVIHCSAGVGRTGTFMGLDIIMQRLKSEGKINIFETVKELRFQRMKMVQTIQQYQFLYSCAYQLVKRKFPSKKNDKTNSNDNKTIDLTNRPIESNNKLSFTPNDIESVM